ncbi:MAG: hypothetical protein HYS98_02285 [Deltaproteobacteria bacterium]|nr:hypothetical protein [Deltaproteobacteria bacterium]
MRVTNNKGLTKIRHCELLVFSNDFLVSQKSLENGITHGVCKIQPCKVGEVERGNLNNKGLTLLEILLAAGILLTIATLVVRYQKRAVLLMEDSRLQLTAKMLLQKKMEESLLELEEKKFSDIDFHSETQGDFGEVYKNFRWKQTVKPFNFDLEKAYQLIKNEKSGSLLLEHMGTLSEYIKDSTREVSVIVSWTRQNQPQELKVTTHLVKYDTPLQIGGLGF